MSWSSRQRGIGAASLEDMLCTAERNLRHLPYYTSVFAEDWQPDMNSHVFLSACRDYQDAKEIQGKSGFRGVFTESLVRTLKAGHRLVIYMMDQRTLTSLMPCVCTDRYRLLVVNSKVHVFGIGIRIECPVHLHLGADIVRYRNKVFDLNDSFAFLFQGSCAYPEEQEYQK